MSETEFAQEIELKLDPIPCWRHLDAATYRARIAEIVDAIERETIERHQRDNTAPKGAHWVRRRHPHERPQPGHRSPKPRFHACTKRAREQLGAAYRAFLVAYRAAAECLTAGDTTVLFPENCHPPPLPFVVPLRPEPG